MTELEFRTEALTTARNILEAVQGREVPHQVFLSALLLAFETVVTTHSCCTEEGGRTLIHVGTRLLERAQLAQPAAAMVH